MGEKTDRVILAEGRGEITEKKSRFLAVAAPAATEEEAQRIIEQTKKEHWNARHNCYAYVIGNRQRLQRYSDDGEPSQTAGKPILDVLLGEGICNGVIVVTRYFGGILLGTGGLVRAYGKAAAAALSDSRTAPVCPGIFWKLQTDYNSAGRITYLLEQRDIPVLSREYGQEVILTAAAPAGEAQSLKKALTETAGGKILFLEEEKKLYARSEGNVHIFEMETEELSR